MQNDAVRRPPQAGELWRHFKGKAYKTLAVATHSETGEQMVVYQALYGDFGIFVRPLPMFMSEVDHEKYPKVTQAYRFERMGEAGDLNKQGRNSFCQCSADLGINLLANRI